MAGLIQDPLGEGGGTISQINVTPLIDVMFCLLIIFMVATPLMQPENMPVALPPGRGQDLTEEDLLYSVLSVDAKGRVFLGTLPLAEDTEKMRQEIALNAKLKADGRVFIQGDQSLGFDRVLDVLSAVKSAGISRVGFIIDPSAKRLQEEL